MANIQRVRIAPLSTADDIEMPPFTHGYELVASVMKSVKSNDCTRACIKLTRLVNIEDASAMAEVATFIKFVRYHTRTGRVTNKAYGYVLDKGITALTALRPKVTRERRQVADLEAIHEELSPVARIARPRRCSVIQNFDEVREQRHANNSDALFLRAIEQTDRDCLSYGESGVFKRAVTMLHTSIPELELRTIKTEYGIQRVSGMYLIASHARVLGACVEEGDTMDDIARLADRELALWNANAEARGLDTMEYAPMEPVNAVHHYYWLLLPKHFMEKCRLAKFGKWDFVNKPKPREYQYVD